MTENVLKTALSIVDKQSTLNVKETLDVLKHQKLKMMSWGSRDFKNIENKGLIFKVSGHLHKGYVLVSLSYNDTFTVSLLNIRGRVIETITDVYVDSLTDLIDEKVEKISIYKR